MLPKIEAIPEMDTLIPILLVIRFQRRQDSELYPRSVSVFLDGPNDLDGYFCSAFPVNSFDYLAECALA